MLSAAIKNRACTIVNCAILLIGPCKGEPFSPCVWYKVFKHTAYTYQKFHYSVLLEAWRV